MAQDLASVAADKTKAELALLRGLLEHGLLIDCGVPGIYGRGPVFEDTLQRFNDFVSRLTVHDQATPLHFPPVMNRTYMERVDYLESFPHLAGIIFSFKGTDLQHHELVSKVRAGEDWSQLQSMTEVVLTPAACHPLYPICTGTLPESGKLIDLTSYCFRHEPSPDPARMQMFRMREHVRMGKPDAVVAWREMWMERGIALLKDLGLDAYLVAANDPFFGRGGRMLAVNQREQQLKFEIVTPITSSEIPTAIMSFNYHQDHFSKLYDIRSSDGETAHTACLGFGLERIMIALFKTHGFAPARWPAAVRQKLWP